MLHTKYMIMLACLSAVLGHCFAQKYENVTLLKTIVLNGYDPDVRPLNEYSDVLNLTVGMTIFNILEVDTLRGTLTTTLSLSCQWFDQRITWTPSDYGGINSIMILQGSVWIPPLTLAQPAEFNVMGEKWMHVTYQANGHANWSPGSIVESVCSMDITYWPFDEQTCEISFYPFDYWGGGINIEVSQLAIDPLFESGEWTIENSGAKKRNVYGIPEALFTVTLKRRPVFHVLELILPMFLVCILTGFVFLLPSNSGERVGYAITILLALTVFLTIVSDNIPKLSNPVPILSIGLLCGVLMSGLTTIAVMLNLAIFHRDPVTPVGNWYVTFVNMTKCRSNKVNQDDEIDGTSTNEQEEKPKVMIAFAENDEIVTWKDVSYAIDKLLFVVVTILQILPVIVLMIMFNSY